MNYISINNQISETFTKVSFFSLKKKREHEEEITNHFLDSILKLQSDINNDNLFLEELVLQFEKISWLEDSSIDLKKEETLNLINAIITITLDIHRIIMVRYIFLSKNAKPYASKEIKRLKVNLDDIKEACYDLENIFIILPADAAFQIANLQLQSL